MRPSYLAYTIVSVLLLKESMAKPLGQEAIFHRCYKHLTQSFPHKSNSTLQAVKSGAKTGSVACKELIDSVGFTANGNTTLPDTSNATAVAIVSVFHNLHYSWFSTKNFPEIQDNYIRNIQNVFDASTPALYITRALFDPSSNFDDVFKGDTTLLSKRATSERANSVISPHSSASDILQGIKFTGSGNLIGHEIMPRDSLHNVYGYTNDPSGANPTQGSLPSIVINTHWGGGVLGSQVYMVQNIQGNSLSYKTDGGVNSNRKWSRSVFQDFFCRELPVVRESDVSAFILSNSVLTYRNQRGCVKCHASADPMAGLTRNAKYDRRGQFNDPNGSYAFMTKYAPTKAKQSNFPAAPDSDFYLRPADGSFFYRTYDGGLVSTEVSSMDELGAEFLKLDDPYICTAKRYFEYFTGISADISDIKDPANANFPSLSAHQQRYRDYVVSLGKSLKQHKSLKILIKNIIDHPVYQDSDFKLSE